MRDSIKNRISRRRYIDEPLTEEAVNAICEQIKKINDISGLRIEYIADASDAFSSMRKTYGMFSGVRSVIVMKGPAELADLAERVGYYGEWLVLYITHLGLGSCWVGGTFDKRKFMFPSNEKMLCVITLGMVEEQSTKEKLVRSVSRNRKSAKSRMQGYDEAPVWVQEAMEAVRLAPSAINRQRPVFSYENGVVTATVHDIIKMDLIDLGIAKLHFAAEAGGRFELGKDGRFIKTDCEAAGNNRAENIL